MNELNLEGAEADMAMAAEIYLGPATRDPKEYARLVSS
jgi:hypothetical protein